MRTKLLNPFTFLMIVKVLGDLLQFFFKYEAYFHAFLFSTYIAITLDIVCIKHTSLIS